MRACKWFEGTLSTLSINGTDGKERQEAKTFNFGKTLAQLPINTIVNGAATGSRRGAKTGRCTTNVTLRTCRCFLPKNESRTHLRHELGVAQRALCARTMKNPTQRIKSRAISSCISRSLQDTYALRSPRPPGPVPRAGRLLMSSSRGHLCEPQNKSRQRTEVPRPHQLGALREPLRISPAVRRRP
jgi:hypothetical protein